MAERYEFNDNKTEIQNDENNNTDFSGDIASNEGINLNNNSINKSHAEQFRGAGSNFISGTSEYIGDNKPTGYGWLAGAAFNQREALGQMAYRGAAATMEEAHANYGHVDTFYPDENGILQPIRVPTSEYQGFIQQQDLDLNEEDPEIVESKESDEQTDNFPQEETPPTESNNSFYLDDTE